MQTRTLSIYYRLKPFIPRRVQIGIRRARARVKLKTHGAVWPIDETASTPPKNWKGWPDGRRFAFVLTHDVDTARGQERCWHTIRVAQEHGFRGSYNFVPERYRVSEDLRNFLTGNGFEVGVHGLIHDGLYLTSEKTFRERTVKINRYIEGWKSVGFRTPSMHHNLDWLHGLDIKYDSSTFDTDPFEPQPDGVGTIFPFWVPSGDGASGYVEIPYTLPQDFTLFVILRQRNVDTWKRKLDWVARHGGMALMLVHPDYIDPGNGRRRSDEYPLRYYGEFLRYVSETYRGDYYNGLPRDVARFWSENYAVREDRVERRETREVAAPVVRDCTAAPAGRRTLRVAMLSYSFYESDARVTRYAETLAARGDQVDVISLRKEGQESRDTINRVDVYRIQRRERNEKGRLSYLTRLLKFFVSSSAVIAGRHVRTPYDVLHVHSVPDFEVFAAFLPKLLGAKIILDIHDIAPEFYASKFGAGRTSPFFRALVLMERMSAWFADHVIISNHLWEKALVNRSVGREKCSTILNYPDPALFHRRPPAEKNGKLVMIYPGSLNWHQGLDVAIRAFHRIRNDVPEAEFHIYGNGGHRDSLAALVGELGLRDRVLLKPSVPLSEIVDAMASADIGVVPKRNDPFGGDAFSTKILEFMSLGVPVVVSRTRIDSYYFNDSVVKFFEPEDVDDLADSMARLIKDRRMRENLAENALKFVEEFSWGNRKGEYLELVDRLAGNRERTGA